MFSRREQFPSAGLRARLLRACVALVLTTASQAGALDADVLLQESLNLCTYPVIPPPGFACSELATSSGASSILRLDADSQTFELCDAGRNDFPILEGEAYVVYMPGAAALPVSGDRSCPVVDLAVGVNLVGFPSPPAGGGCYDLLLALGDESAVASVQRFDAATGRFDACSYGYGPEGSSPGGVDFPLGPQAGYLVALHQAVSEFELNDVGLCAGVNRAPLADAGPNQVVLNGETVTLDGSASKDPDDDPLTFSWSVVSVPAGSAVPPLNTGIASPSFVPDVGLYTFELVVNDGTEDGVSDEVEIFGDADSDSDGTIDSLDCAPEDPLIPGAEEICGNDLDDDCSGVVDDLDSDADGFVAFACRGTDLDDSNPAVNPDAVEICADGLDNDSNGLMDAADPVCGPKCEQDGDGYAAADCGGSDADDSDASVFPGAPELCDFLDNDQDGWVDEGCNPGQAVFGPENVTLLSGSSARFTVLDDLGREISWQFSASAGAISPLAASPTVAIYTAPPVDVTTVVRLTAEDPDDPSTFDLVDVVVEPLTGGVVGITPAVATVGLARDERFQASLSVGAGTFPIRGGFWSVNGAPGGSSEFGSIDSGGLYAAPTEMPLPLPATIQVEFAFSRDGPVEATAQVRLAELDLSPETITGIFPGLAGFISAQLVLSDATTPFILPSDLLLVSDNEFVATVDANGLVSAGDQIGRAVVQGTDPVSGAWDSVVVYSRSNASLSIHIIPYRDDFPFMAGLPGPGPGTVEYTRPGASVTIEAIVTPVRGQNAGDEYSAQFGGVVEVKGDGVNVVDYANGDEPADPSNLVAYVERNSGFVTIGGRDGQGTITVTYDDGFFPPRTAVLNVVFTRPELEITVTPVGGEPGDPILVTDLIEVDVQLTNPGLLSSYLTETPLRVIAGGGEKFFVAYSRNAGSGVAADPGVNNLYVETDAFILSAAATNDKRHEAVVGNRPESVVQFRISPRRDGDFRFAVQVANDPGHPGGEAVFTVEKPKLVSQNCLVEPTAAADGSGRAIANTWPRFNGQAIVATWEDREWNDSPFWTVLQPGQPPDEFPFLDPFAVPDTFREPGDVTLGLAMRDRPEFATEDLTVHVLGPAEDKTFPAIAAAGLEPVTDSFGNNVPPDNQLGGLQISLPGDVAWAIGTPVDVEIQLYSATGEPKPIGQTVVKVSRRTVGMDDEPTTFQRVLRVTAAKLLTGPTIDPPDPVEGSPDGNRVVRFQVTPQGLPPGTSVFDDLILLFGLVETSIFNEAFFIPGLPVQTEDYLDGFFQGVTTAAPFGVADYTRPEDDALFKRQCARLAGFGLEIKPRQIAIASQRLRDLLSDPGTPEELEKRALLPSGVDEKARFVIRSSGPHWDAALETGLVSAELGPGLNLDSSKPTGDGGLEVVLETQVDADEGSVGWLFTFGDGTKWSAFAEVFTANLKVPDEHQDKNLPLNGRHHDAHPVGSQLFRVETAGSFTDRAADSFRVPRLQLELRPSLMPGSELSPGVPIDQPLVGFMREADATGLRVVSGLKQELILSSADPAFLVFGNTTDRRRLDPETRRLGPLGDPDLLPDFTGKGLDTEVLLVGAGGNVADVVFFTAYNVLARVADPVAPSSLDLGFDGLAARGIQATYETYSGLPDVPGSQRVKVSVDKEAGFDNLLPDGRLVDKRSPINFVSGVPDSYFGGVLDQYWLHEVRRGAGGPVNVRIGQDLRVGAFDGDRRSECDGRPLTGEGRRTRRCFGIELDGVLYDPSISPVDEPANGPDLLRLEVVQKLFGRVPRLTDDELLPDQGGTSGGFVELDAFNAGSQFVVSKTPGHEFPGVNAGYLIQGEPEDLVSPITGGAQDDVTSVNLRRAKTERPGGVAGAAILEEKTLGLFPERRRLMLFGGAEDQSTGIETGPRPSSSTASRRIPQAWI